MDFSAVRSVTGRTNISSLLGPLVAALLFVFIAGRQDDVTKVDMCAVLGRDSFCVQVSGPAGIKALLLDDVAALPEMPVTGPDKLPEHPQRSPQCAARRCQRCISKDYTVPAPFYEPGVQGFTSESLHSTV